MKSNRKQQSSRRKFLQAGLVGAGLVTTAKLTSGCIKIPEDQNNPENPRQTETDRKPYKILCCDGGGLKGLITALILQRLEEKINKKYPETQLKDHFDMFAGTSTGSIIACALARGYSAAEIVQIYEDQAAQIFPSPDRLWDIFSQQINIFREAIGNWLNTIKRTFIETIERLVQLDISLPLLDEEADRLSDLLKAKFLDSESQQDQRLSHLTSHVVIVAYDAYNRKPFLLSNLEPDQKNADTRQVEIWKACRSSAAVPGIFSSFLLDNNEVIESLSQGYGTAPLIPENSDEKPALPLVDGAVVTNNPSLWAIQKARSLNPDRPILLASFGTGQYRESFFPSQISKWGLLDWFNPLKGIPLLEIMFSGNSDTVNDISQSWLEGQSDRYFRFQPELTEQISAFTSDDLNIKNMKNAASSYLTDIEQALDQLVVEL